MATIEDVHVYLSRTGHLRQATRLSLTCSGVRAEAPHGTGKQIFSAALKGDLKLLTQFVNYWRDSADCVHVLSYTDTETGFNVLHAAIAYNDARAVRLLLAKDLLPHIDVNALTLKVENGGNEKGEGDEEEELPKTPLMLACSKGNPDIVDMLLSIDDVKVNYVSSNLRRLVPFFLLNSPLLPWFHGHDATKGATALMLAVKHGRTDVVRLLLSHKKKDVDMTQVSTTDLTAFDLAVKLKRKNKEIFTMMREIKLQRDMESRIGHALVEAIANGENLHEIAEIIAAHGDNARIINFQSVSNGWPCPLYLACDIMNVEIVVLLLSAPAIDVNLSPPRFDAPLFTALKRGSIEIVRALVGHPRIDLNNSSAGGGFSLLVQIAVLEPNRRHVSPEEADILVQILHILLDTNRININRQDKCGRTAYGFAHFASSLQNHHHAVIYAEGESPVAIALKNAGCVLSSGDYGAELMSAAYAKKYDLLKSIIDSHGANREVIHWHRDDGYTTLHSLISLKSTKAISYLLNNSPALDVNYSETSCHGYTYLIHAVMNRNVKALKLLLAVPNINVNMVDLAGQNALMHCIQADDFQSFQLLLAHPGTNINYRVHAISPFVERLRYQVHAGGCALMLACRRGMPKYVDSLLAKNARVDIMDDDGQSPLMHAVSGRNARIVKSILAASGGVNVNYKCKQFGSALHLAVTSECLDCVKLLLALPDIDVNSEMVDAKTNEVIETVLMTAARNSNLKILKLLLAHPKIHHINRRSGSEYKNSTAFLLAARYGGTEKASVIRFLLALPDVSINDKTSEGFTALAFVAAKSKLPDTVVASALLKQKNIEINTRVTSGRLKGKTPLQLSLLRERSLSTGGAGPLDDEDEDYNEEGLEDEFYLPSVQTMIDQLRLAGAK